MKLISNNLYIDLQFWELIKTTGASVKGGFGHSSTYDHLTRLIYVFGGYHSFNFADNILVDLLYAYDPKKESWFVLVDFSFAITNLMFSF